MTRVKICLGILGLLVSISVFSGIWVNKRCSEMIEDISAIEECLRLGDKERAAALAEEMDGNWDSFRKKTLVLLSNDRLTEINKISLRIVYLINEDSDETTAELAELRDMTEFLKNSEIPLITSIF